MSQPQVRIKSRRQAHDKGQPEVGLTITPTLPAKVVTQAAHCIVGGDNHVHTHVHYHDQPTAVIEAILRAVPNLRQIHQDTLAKATPGTGMWLLKSERFGLWLEANGNLKILWGSGIPGAGKTIPASLVIDLLEKLVKVSGRQICVAYVYIRYSDRSELTVKSILEILVKQTAERQPDLLPAIHETYAEHIRDGTQPTEAHLLGLMQKLTENVTTAYVLDALDEAPVSIQLDLVKKLASLKCKIFITSRPLKAVEVHFPAAHCFSVVAQGADIDLLIEQKLEKSANLQEAFTQGAKSFKGRDRDLYQNEVRWDLDAICQCLSLHEVKETLEAFPAEIEDFYLQTWKRILNQNPKAQRSMSIQELQHAVATSPEDSKFNATRLVPEATLMGLCRGLVVLEEESRMVRLVPYPDYTAKATLEQLLTESFPYPHSLLATICMTHLADCGFQNAPFTHRGQLEAALDADPLVAYAHGAWAFHVRQTRGTTSGLELLYSFDGVSHVTFLSGNLKISA
ncbi:hypothetical protein BKA70DRAFT_1221671 [Coprinopsis sp. MPI-PUGE-AT-0042]|nr:hypothetical protein BKA70DRAFT_1221671 [Coprinopsis sp. MPI-PUGE-AT-0042]